MIRDMLAIFGFVLLVGGSWLISPPCALIATGAVLITFAFVGAVCDAINS